MARKFHVSVKSIKEANPGIDPNKLKIGKKIQIPAPSAAVAPSGSAGTSAEPMGAGGEQAYTVKSGDTLSKIAKEKGTTVKAIRAANNLKTDRITVGQKLKIPTNASAPATSTPVPTQPDSETSTGAPPSR